jgi:hypothetical protein
LPKHWWRLGGDNPHKKDHDEKLKKVVRDHGGDPIFVGYDPSKKDPSKPGSASSEWYALVDTEGVADPDALGRALGARESGKVLRTADEPDED